MENEMMFQLYHFMMEQEMNEHATEKPLEELGFFPTIFGTHPPPASQ